MGDRPSRLLERVHIGHDNDYEWEEDDNRDEEAVGKLNAEKNKEYSEDELIREQVSKGETFMKKKNIILRNKEGILNLENTNTNKFAKVSDIHLNKTHMQQLCQPGEKHKGGLQQEHGQVH